MVGCKQRVSLVRSLPRFSLVVDRDGRKADAKARKVDPSLSQQMTELTWTAFRTGFDPCADRESDLFFLVMDKTKFPIENECDKCAGLESSNDHGDEAN